jgi:hypothetical protein
MDRKPHLLMIRFPSTYPKPYPAPSFPIIDQLQGIILGCTELPMIIKTNDLELPILNTTEIHVNKIVDTIFSNGGIEQ